MAPRLRTPVGARLKMQAIPTVKTTARGQIRRRRSSAAWPSRMAATGLAAAARRAGTQAAVTLTTVPINTLTTAAPAGKPKGGRFTRSSEPTNPTPAAARP